MAYVDGFVIPIQSRNLAAYRKMSKKAGEVWMDHGALDYKECSGDDMHPEGMTATFQNTLKLKRGETVVFSWIVYASKAERNRILKSVMADPRLAAMSPKTMPFDLKRMLVAGFDVLVDMAPKAAPKKSAARSKRAMPKKKTAKRKTRRA
jgi:uncharacterized protein YbaA (DUF1428 family)